MPHCFSVGRASATLLLCFAAGVALLASADAGTTKPAGAPAAQAPAAAPAQPPTATPATTPAQPAPVEPGMTTADFGDWVLRCQPIKTGGDTRKVCEVGESIQVQGQTGPIARVAIGRLNRSDPLRVTVLLPNNIVLPSSVKIGPASPETSSVDLPWRRCLPGACVADTEIRDETLKIWRTATDGGRIAFRDAAGRDVSVPFSFKGLALALDALAKEPRDM